MAKKQLKCANLRDISDESGDKMSQKILWGSPVIMNVKRDLREEEVQKYRIIYPFFHWNCPFSNRALSYKMRRKSG